MYPSGRWRGYWEQVVWGRQAMRELVLRFEGGAVEGRGEDVIGPFIFRGTYDDGGGVAMVKQYVGRHRVVYHGAYDGEGTIFGRWAIGDEWSGPFALRPDDAGAAADVPILAVAADPPKSEP
jgi:hypothetical protein